MRGNLGMSRDFESCQQRLSRPFQRKFFQIKFRGFLKVADGFRHRFALRGGTGFRIEGGEPAVFGRNQNSSKRHAINLPEYDF